MTIHARERSGLYQSRPDHRAFAAAFAGSANPVCYNGSIVDAASFSAIQTLTPALDMVMLGRGAVANPGLFRELRGGAPLAAAELRAFLDRLLDAFLSDGLPERFALARMKEVWYYAIHMFPASLKGAKAINKAQTLADYRKAVDALFREGSFSASAAFRG